MQHFDPSLTYHMDKLTYDKYVEKEELRKTTPRFPDDKYQSKDERILLKKLDYEELLHIADSDDNTRQFFEYIRYRDYNKYHKLYFDNLEKQWFDLYEPRLWFDIKQGKTIVLQPGSWYKTKYGYMYPCGGYGARKGFGIVDVGISVGPKYCRRLTCDNPPCQENRSKNKMEKQIEYFEPSLDIWEKDVVVYKDSASMTIDELITKIKEYGPILDKLYELNYITRIRLVFYTFKGDLMARQLIQIKDNIKINKSMATILGKRFAFDAPDYDKHLYELYKNHVCIDLNKEVLKNLGGTHLILHRGGSAHNVPDDVNVHKITNNDGDEEAIHSSKIKYTDVDEATEMLKNGTAVPMDNVNSEMPGLKFPIYTGERIGLLELGIRARYDKKIDAELHDYFPGKKYDCIVKVIERLESTEDENYTKMVEIGCFDRLTQCAII